MEIKDYEFQVTNIKASVKLPQRITLDTVEERCKYLGDFHKIYSSRKKRNILSVRYNNFTFVLFKGSSKRSSDGSYPPQHCNITKLRNQEEITQAIEDFCFLINQPSTFLTYKIDNYSCVANIFKVIDIASFYKREISVNCTFTEENFSCVTVYCPKDLTSSPRQCCHIYRTGYFVLVGAKELSEAKKFFFWIIERIKPYIK